MFGKYATFRIINSNILHMGSTCFTNKLMVYRLKEKTQKHFDNFASPFILTYKILHWTGKGMQCLLKCTWLWSSAIKHITFPEKEDAMIQMSCRLSVQWGTRRNQFNVIYSAYSLSTNSTAGFYHGLLLITQTAQDNFVWSFFVCDHRVSCFYGLSTHHSTRATGLMMAKLKHECLTVCLSLGPMALELLYIQIA